MPEPQNGRIIIVDDSRIARMALSRELEPLGFELIHFASGLQAITYLQKNDADLMMLDIEMPGLDGFETCNVIRTDLYKGEKMGIRNPQMPIVFSTSADTISRRERGFKVGATDFIEKSFLPGELFDLVKSILYADDELKGQTVLLVEKSQTARRFAQLVLKEQGLEILEADSYEQGLQLFLENIDDIDLVMVEDTIPGPGGRAFCVKIRKEIGDRTIPLVCTSTLKKRQNIIEVYKAGASDYLESPYLKEELLARVISHLKEKRKRVKLKDALERLDRVSDLKDNFLAACTHDLKLPLSVIKGYLKILEEKFISEEKGGEIVSKVRTAIEHMSETIGNIVSLDGVYNGDEELVKTEVDSLALCRESIDLVTALCQEKSIQLVVELEANLPPIYAHRGSITRIMNNILSNAIKFTPVGGTIRVNARLTGNQAVVISVEDSGKGMDEAMQKDLFSRYNKSRTKGTAGESGTGLGLSIVKGLLERHEGTIVVDSEPGKGSKFEFTIPAMKPSMVA